MVQRPELTYEAFMALAHQQGLEMNISRLEELLPEVQAMFRRIKLLDQVDTADIQPGLGFILADTGTLE